MEMVTLGSTGITVNKTEDFSQINEVYFANIVLAPKVCK